MSKNHYASIVISLLIASVVFLALGADAAKYPAAEPIEVTIDASDTSVELVGYLFLPNQVKFPNPPLVVLLHEKGRSHVIWNDFAQSLAAKGFAAMGMDLRGYGLSIYNLKTGRNRDEGTFYGDEILRYPQDVRELVGQVFNVAGDKIDTNRVAVIGSAIGANTALLYAVNEPKVQYVGMISPGMEINSLCIAPAIRDYGSRPLFMATAEKDIYSVETCYLISDLSPRVLDLHVYDTYYHGTPLVNRVPELQDKLISDLNKYLRP
jgi:dienelactone hydrolase